jgi:hypothetical protein
MYPKIFTYADLIVFGMMNHNLFFSEIDLFRMRFFLKQKIFYVFQTKYCPSFFPFR